MLPMLPNSNIKIDDTDATDATEPLLDSKQKSDLNFWFLFILRSKLS